MKSKFAHSIRPIITIFSLTMIIGVTSLNAQTGTVSVDARAAIFGAGNAGLPPSGGAGVTLNPVRIPLAPGIARILRFTSVSGTVSPQMSFFSFGPDGGYFNGSTVNLTSFGGISGVVDTSNNSCLGLMGVVTAGIPSNAAPSSPDVTTLKTQASFFPILYQQFFIGDGLTGRGTGQQQTFNIPDQATDLYLGFSDGVGFQGSPCCYWDNTGSLSATYSVTGYPLSIPNTNINEQVLWQYTPTVSGSGYTFGLSNAPTGMTVNTNSGTISWTPTEAQGPSTNANITYVVYQSGTNVASTNLTVIVNEVNVAPVLHVPGTQTLYATTTLTVTNTATDQDIPSNTLTFAIVSAPSGVVLDPNTGALTWTPTSGQVGNNTITVSVTDNNPWAVNSQHLSVTNSFTVIVNGLTAPSFTLQPVSQVVGAGQSVTFTAAATGYPPPTYQWQFNGTNINGATDSTYTIPSTGLTNIGYYTVVIANSVNTNTSASASASLTFLNLAMYAGLNIIGPIGANYNIQSIPALNATNWTTLTNISLPTQPYIYIDYNSPTNSRQFYRALPQ